MTPVIGSLCSGYGGLDIALSAVTGGRVAWHVEYDADPSKILAHRFPSIPNYGDVKTTDWSAVAPIDWLTAGYPCQPFSLIGSKKGVDDPRHLWPDVARAISVLRPRGVLLENVAAHLRVGFDTVLGDLADLGYDARWGVVRASDAGAPHGRARLFCVATRDSQVRGWHAPADANGGRGLPVTSGGSDSGLDWGVYAAAVRRWERILGRPAPAPTADGRLSPRFVEWLMGLPEGWVTDVPGLRPDAQRKALGNGVVPQQAMLAYRLLAPSANEVALSA